MNCAVVVALDIFVYRDTSPLSEGLEDVCEMRSLSLRRNAETGGTITGEAGNRVESWLN